MSTGSAILIASIVAASMVVGVMGLGPFGSSGGEVQRML